MNRREKRKLIDERKHEIARYLNDLDEADDLDLWEDAAAKLNDILVVYKNEGRANLEMTESELARRAFEQHVEEMQIRFFVKGEPFA